METCTPSIPINSCSLSSGRPQVVLREKTHKALSTITTLCLLLFCAAVAEGSVDCPDFHVRLSHCDEQLAKLKKYTNQELFDACNRSRLGELTQCLQDLLDFCDSIYDVNNQQVEQAQRQADASRKRIHDMCVTVMEYLSEVAAVNSPHTPGPGTSSASGLTSALSWPLRTVALVSGLLRPILLLLGLCH